ncbi:MAG: VanW family protein [Deltaproteobacteria bacterium]|nr:VanW family protein [Deltaproteobacteria bacterium]
MIRAPYVVAFSLRGAPPKEAYHPALWPVRLVGRDTPLERPGAQWTPKVQRAKETNVRLAAAAIDGAVIWPGEVFSWHRWVGPPLRARGFQAGPELHGDTIGLGVGGGACQLANMLFWLAVHAGLEITERHRHGYDLFPDHERTVPFGAGATVYHPSLDLRLRNPHEQPLVLRAWVLEGRLFGEIRGRRPLPSTWRLVERGARFFAEGDVIWRENTLVRERLEGGVAVEEEILGHNLARVLYPVPPEEVAP